MSLHERLRTYRAELDGAIGQRTDADTHTVVVPTPRDRSRVVIGVAVVAVVAMVASAVIGIVRSADHRTSGRLTVEALLHAPLAQSVRIVTTQASGPSYPHIVSTGIYDFDHNIARIQGHAVDVHGQPVANADFGPILYVDGNSYARISADEAKTLPESIRRQARWTVERDDGNLGANRSFDPFTALAELRRRSALRDLGPTRVDGRAVEHYEALVAERVAPSTAPSSTMSTPSGESRDLALVPATGALGSARYDLYVDGDRRLVRLVVAYPAIASFHVTQQLDFSDYGLAVDVAAPPTDQVVDFDDMNVDFAPPKLTGPWTRIASGTTAGDAWKLYRAPADHERECWSFESPNILPQLTGEILTSSPASATSPTTTAPASPLEHDGNHAICSRTGVWASPLSYVFEGVDVTRERMFDVGIVDRDVVDVEWVTASGVSRVALDPRFQGFVRSERLGSGYRLHLRDGRTINCDGPRGGGPDAPTCPSTDN